jgi:hypothetical protein
MFPKSKNAVAAAIILNIASLALASYAFAQDGKNPRVWGDDIMQSRDTYEKSTVPRDPTNSIYQSNAYRYVPLPNLEPSNKMDR